MNLINREQNKCDEWRDLFVITQYKNNSHIYI